VFEWITDVIERLGYVGVAMLTFLESRVSADSFRARDPLAGFVAARGGLRLSLVILMGSLGS
jgi:hypothetical protein